MKAPDVEVVLHTGESVPLARLYAERPVMLIFLRHLGCLFCREQVAQFRDHPDLNVVFVAMSEPAALAEFRGKMFSPHAFLADPNRSLYQAFGLKRAHLGQILSPRTLAGGMRATLSGHRQGLPQGDPLQLAGAFVLDRQGEVVWERRSRDAADEVSPDEARAILLEKSQYCPN